MAEKTRNFIVGKGGTFAEQREVGAELAAMAEKAGCGTPKKMREVASLAAQAAFERALQEHCESVLKRQKLEASIGSLSNEELEQLLARRNGETE